MRTTMDVRIFQLIMLLHRLHNRQGHLHCRGIIQIDQRPSVGLSLQNREIATNLFHVEHADAP